MSNIEEDIACELAGVNTISELEKLSKLYDDPEKSEAFMKGAKCAMQLLIKYTMEITNI